MFMDIDLARRLEHAEGTICASYIEPRNRLAAVGAAWKDFGGTSAVFDGVDSPLTQTFGLGVFSPAGHAELETIEDWFTAKGADTNHEVSPFAGVDTHQVLVARGYRPIELSTVLVQPLDEARRATPAGLRVRIIDPVSDGVIWVETSIAGWSSDPAVVPFIRTIAEVNIANTAVTHYVVERDGLPIATGSMGVVGDVALLAGASTVPSARGIGAQAAVLAVRLADARARGCTAAMMVASVGSTSQRNAERNGFRVAYTRTKWQRKHQ